MPTGSKHPASKWHEEVPGARWFRADLHVHTLDDAPGNATWASTPGLSSPQDPSHSATREAYARAFLKAAVAAGIEVIGLTPHSARANGSGDASVAWDIVEAWKTTSDDDGTPFTQKIYAVFPGFEPSVADGSGGLHLLFLFDPQVGKSRYLSAFTIVTGGQDVWREGKLQPSPKTAKDVFESLNDLKAREGDGWDFICLAAHAFSEKGLIKTLKGELLRHFPISSVAGLELKDNDIPEDVLGDHPYLKSALDTKRLSLFHASDAYCLVTPSATEEAVVPLHGEPGKRGIGYRYTHVKLASPRIESLRQALLSSDSRVRLAYSKGDKGLTLRGDNPTAIEIRRPWLRALRVEGGASFFAGHGKAQTFRFSPDLTCLIGGRMAGKSTLLDGLRLHCQHSLPEDKVLAGDVRERGNVLLAGDPAITLDILGNAASTLSLKERWPARFFTQRELARITKDNDAVRQILFFLAPGSEALRTQFHAIGALDVKLAELADRASRERGSLAEKEQARKTAADAKTALGQFRDAGADRLAEAQANVGRVSSFAESLAKMASKAADARAALKELTPPSLHALQESVSNPLLVTISAALDSSSGHLQSAAQSVQAALSATDALKSAVSGHAGDLRKSVQAALVAQGRKADDLGQFDALSALAAKMEAADAAFQQASAALVATEKEFEALERERANAVTAFRSAMRGIIEAVNASIPSIRLSLDPGCDRQTTDAWIKGLRDGGITRWWNDSPRVTDPAVLFAALRDDRLGDVGMSPAVALRFKEVMTEERRLQLRSLRSEDRFPIQAKVEKGSDGAFRPIERLSGGKQVSVMLSLLLESTDASPLVIDQPEDELDKAFLTETLLPVLRRLKGRRQVIFATHDANIVVNGDADQVIFLDATKDYSEAKAQGAIDDPIIRDGILHILDGGRQAFGLRKRKYGF